MLMKYVNQLQYPNMQYITRTKDPDEERRKVGLVNTIAKSGCGICSAVMVADRLRVDDGSFELEHARQLSYDSGANHAEGTDGSIYFPAFAEKFKLVYENSDKVYDLLYCLRTGDAAIIKVGGDREGYKGVFSDRWRHYIVAVAEERDGRIAVLDPSYKDANYEKEGRKGKVEVLQPGFGRCSLQVIKEETQTVPYPFYLFWRK